jgi:tetratricopeptide (TPR) repeat protein
MSRTLLLINDGWAVAQKLVRDGRGSDALDHLNRLLGRVDLPGPIAADAHRSAAKLHLDMGQFAKARRRLRTLLSLVGRTFEDDAKGSDERAARWYKKATALAPTVTLYRAAFGRAAVRCNHLRTGIQALQRASAAAPGDLAVLRIVVDGLLEAGRIEEARRAIQKARFLCLNDKELGRLEQRVKFESARKNQRKTQDATSAKDGGLISLPFIRVVGGEETGRGIATIRRDLVSRSRPHFNRLRFGTRDRG